jgi:hypothetical protein
MLMEKIKGDRSLSAKCNVISFFCSRFLFFSPAGGDSFAFFLQYSGANTRFGAVLLPLSPPSLPHHLFQFHFFPLSSHFDPFLCFSHPNTSLVFLRIGQRLAKTPQVNRYLT